VAGSYRAINYSLRPAKTIERKLFCEVFRRLYPFGRIEQYRYVGFGSLYFSDFALVHRTLGIHNMLSIEKDVQAAESFRFNRPYRCIGLEFREASEVLSGLDWTSRTIAWLDYDGKLTEDVLSDIGTVSARASSGSVLIASVNVQVESPPDEQVRTAFSEETGMDFELDAFRLKCLSERIGRNVPADVSGADLRGKGLAKVSHRVISNAIMDALSARNAASDPSEKMRFEQVVNLVYRDNALMLSVGGVFYREAEIATLKACAFEELGFVRSGPEYYEVHVPCLTVKEMHQISTLLPRDPNAGTISLPGVPAADIRHFAELYRYFPAFAETVFT